MMTRCTSLLLLSALALGACLDVHDDEHHEHNQPASDEPAHDDEADHLQDDGDLGPARDQACPEHVPFTASVHARVVDEDGAGLADARVQLCVWTVDARMLCLEPGRTDAAGDVLVDVAAPARCMVSATARVLLPQSRRPALYCGVELSLDDASVTVAAPYTLIEAAAPAALPAIGQEDQARAVAFDGLAVEVRPAAIGAEAYQRLAATTLTPEQAPACLAAEAPDFDLLVAFSPEVDVMGAGFPLTLDNELGLAPGDAVELAVQGGLECTLDDGSAVEKAAWHTLGTAIVSADGERIVTSGATSVPCLGWLGVRRR